MILITPEDFVSETTELLRSVQTSVRDLRTEAERLCQSLNDGEDDADLLKRGKRLSTLAELIRICQKLENNLVEHHGNQAGIAQGGYALDLAEARSEIGCRFSRLRTCYGMGGVSE